MAETLLIAGAQREQWLAAVQACLRFDFYHLPDYHALAIESPRDEALLFVHRAGEYLIALPLILRRVTEVPGLEEAPGHLRDATSVYGYTGPLASHETLPREFIAQAQAALRNALLSLGAVAVFSRLHPLLGQAHLLAGLGDISTVGQTVAIDLSLSPDTQRSQYRENHTRGINKLQRLGIQCIDDTGFQHLDAFAAIYLETMARVAASDAYLFAGDYFERFIRMQGCEVRLFVCLAEGEPICGGLFVLCNGIVQYHLGGTRDDAIKLAPSKLLFETVRVWANQRGARAFHLGGGLGARDDSLFHFKSGFSHWRLDFRVWRWICDPPQYADLCRQRFAHTSPNTDLSSTEFFPLYRLPGL